MTTRSAASPQSADPAIALADALQSTFAAQRSGCQRSRQARETAAR